MVPLCRIRRIHGISTDIVMSETHRSISWTLVGIGTMIQVVTAWYLGEGRILVSTIIQSISIKNLTGLKMTM
jgi:hypothetical protein